MNFAGLFCKEIVSVSVRVCVGCVVLFCGGRREGSELGEGEGEEYFGSRLSLQSQHRSGDAKLARWPTRRPSNAIRFQID